MFARFAKKQKKRTAKMVFFHKVVGTKIPTIVRAKYPHSAVMNCGSSRSYKSSTRLVDIRVTVNFLKYFFHELDQNMWECDDHND